MLALVSTTALADERSPEYEQAYKSGTELFAKEAFAAARAQFLAAYELHPEPLLLLNIGSTFRRENNPREAIGYYQRFLAEAEPANEYRARVTEIVEELEQQIADDDERKRREAEAAKPPLPEPEPIVEPEPTRAATSRAGGGLRLGGVITTGFGVIALGVGVQQGMHARSIHDELEGKRTGTEWTPEVQDRFDEGESAETRAIVLTVGGGVLLATGVTLYLLGRSKGNAERPPRVTVAPYTDGTTTGFALGGRF